MEEAITQANWGRTTPGSANVPTDTDLLRRFATNRDEAAFTLLVQRHGPLVLSVCRRVLGSVPDAEDAFQATFLVLARKAGSIRDPGLLGNWLYGVASRIARKARAGLSKRQMHEKQLPLLPSLQAPASPAPDDPCPVLDEELSRLPEKYRAALVLCYLEGRTNEEAARVLNWPTGTVKGRLARARELLRTRLLRRGWRMSALVLVAFLSGSRARAGSVSPDLAKTTAKVAVKFAGGAQVVAGASPHAVQMANVMLRSLRSMKWLAVVLVLAVATISTITWLYSTGTIGRDFDLRSAFSSEEDSGGCHSSPSTTGH